MPPRNGVCTDAEQQRNEVCTDPEQHENEVCAHEDEAQRARISRPPVLSSPDQSPSEEQAAPVDNSAAPGEDQERRRSATKGKSRARSKSPPTCDGHPCEVRDLRCGARRQVALIVGETEAATIYGGHSDLSRTMLKWSARICELCRSQFAEVERPERDAKCEARRASRVRWAASWLRTAKADRQPAGLPERRTEAPDARRRPLRRRSRERAAQSATRVRTAALGR